MCPTSQDSKKLSELLNAKFKTSLEQAGIPEIELQPDKPNEIAARVDFEKFEREFWKQWTVHSGLSQGELIAVGILKKCGNCDEHYVWCTRKCQNCGKPTQSSKDKK